MRLCVAMYRALVIQVLAIPLASRKGYTALAVELGLTFGGGEPLTTAPHAVGSAADDDLSLVNALAKGDARALEVIYDRYSRGVYSLALRLLNDGPAAEEVVQETFLKLWRQPSAYQPARGRLLPWLLGVSHHQAVDVLRRRQLEQRHRMPPSPHANGDALVDMVDNLGLTSSDGDPQLRAGAFEQRAAVSRALASLPIEQRLPLQLAYFRGMTQFEVARLLDLPLGTVKTRMRLGLQQLRKAPDLSRLWSDG
jgi:RNA polymerase sigma-70 factor (ECF subfamily)